MHPDAARFVLRFAGRLSSMCHRGAQATHIPRATNTCNNRFGMYRQHATLPETTSKYTRIKQGLLAPCVHLWLPPTLSAHPPMTIFFRDPGSSSMRSYPLPRAVLPLSAGFCLRPNPLMFLGAAVPFPVSFVVLSFRLLAETSSWVIREVRSVFSLVIADDNVWPTCYCTLYQYRGGCEDVEN